MEKYHIKLEQFEGPLDLLLALTEQEKLDITRISLAKITDEYLEYINKAQYITLQNLAEFLSVAAKLILIKSKALLPLLEFTEEEEEEIRDLEHQLAQYKKFKDAALEIAKLIESKNFGFTREGFQGLKTIFYPPENIVADDLKNAFAKVLGEIQVVEKLEQELVSEVLTLEEKIVHLQNHLRDKVQTSFAELIKNTEDKVEVVVSFLAMLEMVKQRLIYIEQDELFGEIKMRHKEEE